DLTSRERAGGFSMTGRILITGGAGFVGTNVAKRLAGAGMNVRILDSLARAGSEENVDWLREAFPDRIELIEADVRDVDAVRAAVDGDRKSTRLNSSHVKTSYAVFCLKKKNSRYQTRPH